MQICKMMKVVGVAAALGGLAAVGVQLAAPESAVAASPAPVQNSTPFAIDQVHSSIIYRIKHMNVAYNYGRFNDMSGKFLLDKSDPSKSVVEISVNVESIDSNNDGRDKHLKSPDFFSAKEFPTITFVGKSFKKSGDDAFEVTGDLTMKGKSKSITVTITDTGVGPGRKGGEVAGYESTFTIKRSEFGMDYLLQALGDEVTLIVGVEGARS